MPIAKFMRSTASNLRQCGLLRSGVQTGGVAVGGLALLAGASFLRPPTGPEAMVHESAASISNCTERAARAHGYRRVATPRAFSERGSDVAGATNSTRVTCGQVVKVEPGAGGGLDGGIVSAEASEDSGVFGAPTPAGICARAVVSSVQRLGGLLTAGKAMASPAIEPKAGLAESEP